MIENKDSLTQKNSYFKELEEIFADSIDISAGDEEPVKKEISMKDFTDKDIILKTVLIGDSAVGKTSIRNAFMGRRFKTTYKTTIGADFAVKELVIHGEKKIKIQIWDLAGQQRFDTIRSNYYLGANAGMIVFDLTRPDTFSNIVKWMNELWINNGAGPIPFVVLGNKNDLILSDRNIKTDITARSFALGISRSTRRKYGFYVSFLSTSAKTGENIDRAFRELAINYLTWNLGK
ncbi:MAG: Rab family GTPase [Candidatus Hodarchaeales archaeon]